MKKVVSVSLLVLAMSGACVQAQVPPMNRIMAPLNRVNGPGQGAGPAGGPMMAPPGNGASTSAQPDVVEIPSPLLLAMDTNHDRILDAAEINNAPNALKTLDKNGDGQLTPDEYLAPGEDPSTSVLIKALDMDGNGIISAKEMSNAPSNLRVLDKNFDGKLGPGEYKGIVPVKVQQTTNSN